MIVSMIQSVLSMLLIALYMTTYTFVLLYIVNSVLSCMHFSISFVVYNNCDISRRCCDIYRQRIFCDISRQQCDIYRQWGLRRFQQIATFPGDGTPFSVDNDVSRRCDISRSYRSFG